MKRLFAPQKLRSSFCLKATAITALLLFCPSRVVLADVIMLVADEWCPYNCRPGAERQGYMVDLANEIFTAAGHRVEYQNVAWSRAIKGVTEGEFTGLIACTPIEAPDCIFPDEDLMLAGQVFVVRKGDPWRFDGIESLKTIRLGAIQDYDYEESLNAYIAASRHSDAVQLLKGSRPAERNLKKLLARRIDVYLENKDVVMYNAMRMEISHRIEIAAATPNRHKLYIAFSPQNPNSRGYAQILTDGIRQMRRDGRLAQILADYGLSDWKTAQ